jgi:hypothetical protein
MTRDASCPNCGAPQRWHRYPCPAAGEEEPRKPKLSELLADEPRIFPAEPIAAGEECTCSWNVVEDGFDKRCPIHGEAPAEPVVTEGEKDATNKLQRPILPKDNGATMPQVRAGQVEPAVTELVERLRDPDRHHNWDMRQEAADALTRLEAEKETCERFELRHRKQIDVLIGENRIRDITIAALQSERDELRAQLSVLQYQGQDK